MCRDFLSKYPKEERNQNSIEYKGKTNKIKLILLSIQDLKHFDKAPPFSPTNIAEL